MVLLMVQVTDAAWVAGMYSAEMSGNLSEGLKMAEVACCLVGSPMWCSVLFGLACKLQAHGAWSLLACKICSCLIATI